jgi:hypothetical protein
VDSLKRVIEVAHVIGSLLVRMLTQRKEQILWGKNDAEKWNVVNGVWGSIAPVITPAVGLVKPEGVGLVVTTGNGDTCNNC